MIIIDNALPEQFFESLKDQIFEPEFSWYFGKTSNELSSESVLGYSFSHLAYKDGVSNSNVSYDCRTALILCLAQKGFTIDNLSRIRIGLLTPSSELNHVNVPHVDSAFSHYVGILYLNDSDGTTKIYDQTYNYQSEVSEPEYYDKILKRNVTIKQEIEPKRNRFVLFDGKHYHSSTCPSNVERRVVINYNFTVK